jgi:hypothetical protein
MGLNWVEDLVSHLYQLRGYLVIQNEDLPMPNQAHSDIDVIAIKDGEVRHVECQSWWGPRKDDARDLKRLKDRFENAPERIFDKYNFLRGFATKRVFVTSGKPKHGTGSGPWDRLSRFCAENQIELVEINTVIRELLGELKLAYPTIYKVGKEEGIARFLLHLIHNGFIAPADSRRTEAALNKASEAEPEKGSGRFSASLETEGDGTAEPADGPDCGFRSLTVV